MVKVAIGLSEEQAAFVDSDAVYRGFCGGRGAGKTWIGAYDLLRRAKPKRLYGVYAPSYPMLRDSTLRMFLEIAGKLGTLADMNLTQMRATIGDKTEVLFRSLDDPERARGPNLSGAWIDEASLVPRKAYDIIIACLREGGEQGWLSATFTPKGKLHWTYEVFGQKHPDVALFRCPTAHNPFVPMKFVEGVRGQYTPAYAQQELEGLFVDLAGAIAKRDWFRVVDALPDGVLRCRAWDLAATEKKLLGDDPDWTVGVLWAKKDGHYYVENVVRARVGPGAVEDMIKQTALLDGRKVWVHLPQDPGATGKIALAALVRMLAGWRVMSDKPTGDKVSRAMPFLSQAHHGNVSLVRGQWNKTWLDEVCAFPTPGVHDDIVDASSDGFNMLSQVRRPLPRVRGGIRRG